MRFGVLGPLEVFDGRRVLDLGPRMPRAVLAALLIDANRVVSLDRLLDRLWGESPPAQAVASLQAHISRLRRVLEPDRPSRTPAQVLVTDPPGYRLAVAPEDFDVTTFERLLDEGRAHLRQGRPEAARQALRRGLGLWRGPAYADLDDAPFVEAECRRLTGLRLDAQEALADAELALGVSGAVVSDLERLAGEHPLRERLWELLMLALYRTGRQADALRAYQRARTVLAQELGIEPGRTLQQLEIAILEQDPSLTWRRPQEAEMGETPAVPAAGGATSVDPLRLLVGREAQRDGLARMLAATAGGEGHLVLLSGEPGIGKTTLAEDLCERAAGEGLPAVWGRCHEGEGAPPLWPWTQVVRDLLPLVPAEVARAALAPGASHIAQIVPEVKEVLGEVDASPYLAPEAARFRLHDAIRTFLVRVASSTPLLVVLDDLHWADPPSLQLLELVVERLPGTPILVLATYRDVEVAAGHPLATALGALARRATMRSRLDGLAPADIAAYVTAATGHQPDARLVERLHGRTEGNPLFMAELVRLLDTGGGLECGLATIEREVPRGVRDVIVRRLARLPGEAVSLLQLAAVVGRDFELDVLVEAARIDEERALELIEGPLLLGLVAEVDAAAGRFRFAHGLIREALYAELSPVRRPGVHQRVAEALERVHGHERRYASEIAHHFHRAGRRGGLTRAIDWGLRAAEHAAEQFAFELREDQLRRALQLVEQLPEGPERDRRELEVLLHLSQLVTVNRSYAGPESGRALVRARELCERVGNHRQLAGVLWRLVAFHSLGGRYGAARDVAARLLDVARASDDPAELFVAHGAVGITALHRGEVRDALAHLQRAGAVPPECHDPALAFWHPVVLRSSFLAWALLLVGEDEQASSLAAEGVEFAARTGDVFGEVHVRFFEAKLAALARDVPRTRQRADVALALAEQHGFPLYAALSRALRGWARANQGEEAGAGEIEEALAGIEAAEARMLQPFLWGLLAEAHLRSGDVLRAGEAVDRALALAGEGDERFYEPELHCVRSALVLAGSGDRAAAAEPARRAVAVARRAGATRYERRALELLGSLDG